jgi:hypothetical protein
MMQLTMEKRMSTRKITGQISLEGAKESKRDKEQ